MLLAVELLSKKSLSLATIKKLVSLHCLLHSYASHYGEWKRYVLMFRSYDVIKELKQPKFTHTQVSTKSIEYIKSPFDDLF